jgi:hypothetical protein
MAAVRIATGTPEVEKVSSENVLRRHAPFFTSESRISLDV